MRKQIFWGSTVLILFLQVFLFFPAVAKGYGGIALTRMYEPNERAFSILVPRGWQSKGGMFRINALNAGGPLIARNT